MEFLKDVTVLVLGLGESGLAMARWYRYIALVLCVVGMAFCWANAALRLYGPSPLLSWASADIDAVLGAVGFAYGSRSELATNSDGTTADLSAPP